MSVNIDRGSAQSIITASIDGLDVAILTDHGEGLAPEHVDEDLQEIAALVDELVAIESGHYGALPPVDELRERLQEYNDRVDDVDDETDVEDVEDEDPDDGPKYVAGISDRDREHEQRLQELRDLDRALADGGRR